MIFVTVGSMLPFDRLIATMDHWAHEHPEEPVFAQIGAGHYEPGHMRFARMLSPQVFSETVALSRLVVAHAGMGSIIMAAEQAVPIVLLPRRRDLGEHTTDHQLHTVRWLKQRPGIFVADNEGELGVTINRAQGQVLVGDRLSTRAPDAFVEKLREAMLR